MLVHGLLVESVDLRRLGGSTCGNDVLGDSFDGCQVAPGEKKIGPLRRKGACDSTADRTSGSVDHRNLFLQHHLWFLSVPGWPHIRLVCRRLIALTLRLAFAFEEPRDSVPSMTPASPANSLASQTGKWRGAFAPSASASTGSH